VLDAGAFDVLDRPDGRSLRALMALARIFRRWSERDRDRWWPVFAA
jgi:uncharacterized protein YjiS (DUF1127 family)